MSPEPSLNGLKLRSVADQLLTARVAVAVQRLVRPVAVGRYPVGPKVGPVPGLAGMPVLVPAVMVMVAMMVATGAMGMAVLVVVLTAVLAPVIAGVVPSMRAVILCLRRRMAVVAAKLAVGQGRGGGAQAQGGSKDGKADDQLFHGGAPVNDASRLPAHP